MITASLTEERVRLDSGAWAFPYPWRGEVVLVDDSAASGVEIAALFADEEIGEHEKALAVINRMFPDPEDAFCACDFEMGTFGELVREVCWDVFGINAGGHHDGEPMWDIDQDAALIRASLRQAYGIEWDEARGSISWHEFLVLVSALPRDTPLGRAMFFRDRRNRPEETKYNRKQVAEFDRLHEHFRIKAKKRSRDHIEEQQRAMDDAALALGRK